MASSLFYPSIGDLKNLRRELPYVFPDNLPANPILRYVGTIKAHGFNSSIISRPGKPLMYQSRHIVLHDDAQLRGFVRFCREREPLINSCFAGQDPKRSDSILSLYGEWCGFSVHKGVGIAKQDPFWVVFAARVGADPAHGWVQQEDQLWQHVHSPDDRVHSIYSFPTFTLSVDLNNPEASIAETQRLAELVGADCPMASQLGTPGSGEGLVFKPTQHSNPRLWFKAKCRAHMVTPSEAKSKVAVPPDEFCQQFVEDNITEARLLQGIAYLKEQGIGVDKKATALFLTWIASNALAEEGGDLTAMQQNAVKRLARERACTWYFNVGLGADSS